MTGKCECGQLLVIGRLHSSKKKKKAALNHYWSCKHRPCPCAHDSHCYSAAACQRKMSFFSSLFFLEPIKSLLARIERHFKMKVTRALIRNLVRCLEKVNQAERQTHRHSLFCLNLLVSHFTQQQSPSLLVKESFLQSRRQKLKSVAVCSRHSGPRENPASW